MALGTSSRIASKHTDPLLGQIRARRAFCAIRCIAAKSAIVSTTPAFIYRAVQKFTSGTFGQVVFTTISPCKKITTLALAPNHLHIVDTGRALIRL